MDITGRDDMTGTESGAATETERGGGPAERTDAGERAGAPGALDPRTTTVHDAIHEIPGAEEVFRRFGLDCCCGGELPVAEAAGRHGVDLDGLLDALEEGGSGA